MKSAAKLLIVCLLLTSLTVPQANSSIDGKSCTKIGLTKKVNKKIFICAKAKKKYVWTKVLKGESTTAINSNPKPEPSPTLTPTPLPSPTPTKAPDYFSADKAKVGKDCISEGEFAATLDGPVTCTGVWSLISREEDSVASRAYRYVLEEYLAKPEGNLSIIWRIDPSTPEWKNKMQTGMIAGARLWGTSPAGSPERYSYVSHDPDWLFDQFVKDGLIKSESRRANMFQGPCNAGLTGAENMDMSFWFYKFSQDSCLEDVGFFQVPSHEYTHYAQEVLSNKGWNRVERVPWLDEGLASFIGGALGPMSEMRNDLRNMWAKNVRRVFRDVAYFERGIPEVYSSRNWGDVYPLGAIANEALVAVIGFKGAKQIYLELSTPNTTYDQAITKVTGVNIAGWNGILQGYVDSVTDLKPWTLEFLLQEYAKKKA